jgi:hypothetical protein
MIFSFSFFLLVFQNLSRFEPTPAPTKPSLLSIVASAKNLPTENIRGWPEIFSKLYLKWLLLAHGLMRGRSKKIHEFYALFSSKYNHNKLMNVVS